MPAACTWYSRLKQPVFLLWALALGVQVLSDWLFRHGELGSTARPFLGLLPALLWVLVIAAFVRAVFKSDELQQRIHMQAVSIAFVLAAVLLLLRSGLARAGIYYVALGSPGSALMFLLLISYIIAAWRYR
jgi:hypothetical protein